MSLGFSFGPAIVGAYRTPVPSRCRLSCRSIAMSSAPQSEEQSALTLISAPVSGYAMRIRYVIAKKGLGPELVQIKAPAEFGGLKSPEYLAWNPLGKMPVLLIHDPPGTHPSALFESKVIADYIIDRFSSTIPSFIPKTPELRAVAHLVGSICDTYIGQLQPFMYKRYDADVDRAAKVKEMGVSFDAVELVLDPTGPYVCGKEISVGDAALFGNLPFYDFMMPTFFGVHPKDGRPKLAKWCKFILQESDAARKCYEEVWAVLEKWWDDGRWENLGMKPIKGGKPVSSLISKLEV